MVRSTFTYHFKSKGDDTVLVIIDKNEGKMSVTNDMENVIEFIVKETGNNDIYDMPIIACDSDGIYDEILIREGGAAQFLPCRTKNEDFAAEIAIDRRKNNGKSVIGAAMVKMMAQMNKK
jgi:ribosomal protein S11